MRALVAALLVAGCSSSFDPGSRVTRTRLLAVSADRPFAQRGELVTLDALALDPAGRTLTFGWATCAPSGATVADCLAVMDRTSLVIEPERTRHTVTVGADYVGVIVVACPGTLSLGDTNGLPFACTVNGRKLPVDQFDVGMKRILVRDERNENPLLTGATFGGVDWPETFVPEVVACDPGDDVDECANRTEIRVTGGRVESGENVVVQYYSTEGTFSAETRRINAPETSWVARPRASGTTITFAIVIRDDRGGVSWLTRRARVR